MALPIYFTGTVSVAAGGTVVTLTGGIWSGINVKQGDFISVNNSDGILITEVTDATHLKIPPWQGAAQTGVTYVIYQNYVGRVVGVAAAEDVGEMLEKLHVDGLPFILGADETVPDPSYGDEGQLAFKPTTGQWWMKSGGVWVPSAGLTALGYGGTSTSSVTIGLSPPPKVFTTQSSLAYNGARVRAASAANLNNFMVGPATYSGTTLTINVDSVGGTGTFSDWLFSVSGSAGPQGPVGPQGIPGPVGPPGASGAGTGNVTGPAVAVTDRIAVFNGTSGTIIKDGGKTIAELLAAGGSNVSTTSTPPSSAVDGDLWFEDDTGLLFIYYTDATPNSQWVQIGGGGGGGGGGTPSDTLPLADGSAAPGVSTTYSRGDHVHPVNTAVSREKLTAPRTYYVRTDGNDGNTGLTNNSGGAFLTIQKAMDLCAATLDLGNQNVTISVGPGTFGPIHFVAMVGLSGAGSLTINGAGPTTIIAGASAVAVSASGNGVTGALSNIKLQTTVSGHCLEVNSGAYIACLSVHFGAAAAYHILVASGGIVTQTGAYEISGNATFHYFVTGGTLVAESVGTVTLTGSPAITNFCYVENGGYVRANGNVYSGASTGGRYNVNTNSTVFTNGAGANYFPGSAAGTTATGGQYV